MKITSVDVNRGFASILHIMLEDEGYEARLAKDSQNGYLTYLLFRPDLVITDIQMPEKMAWN